MWAFRRLGASGRSGTCTVRALRPTTPGTGECGHRHVKRGNPSMSEGQWPGNRGLSRAPGLDPSRGPGDRPRSILHHGDLTADQRTTLCGQLFQRIHGHRPQRQPHQCGRSQGPDGGDLVIAIPDTGNIAALGYEEETRIPYEFGIIRNHYVGRTFDESVTIHRLCRWSLIMIKKSFSSNRCMPLVIFLPLLYNW